MGQVSPRLDRFLSTKEVCHLTGWSRATLWRQWKANRFPQPVPTTEQRVGWLESEIAEWQEKVVADRDARKHRRDQPKAKRPPKAKKISSAGQIVH
jgi:prophage regulatory protein